MADEFRIVTLDSGAIAVWVHSDGPLHGGWYYREFPKPEDVGVLLHSWLTAIVSIKGWEQRDPPDVAEIDRLKLDIEVIRHDEANANYWAGKDEGAAGVYQRWEEALSDPMPKAGVMGEPIESLYRRTEALRNEIKRLNLELGAILYKGY